MITLYWVMVYWVINVIESCIHIEIQLLCHLLMSPCWLPDRRIHKHIFKHFLFPFSVLRNFDDTDFNTYCQLYVYYMVRSMSGYFVFKAAIFE